MLVLLGILILSVAALAAAVILIVLPFMKSTDEPSPTVVQRMPMPPAASSTEPLPDEPDEVDPPPAAPETPTEPVATEPTPGVPASPTEPAPSAAAPEPKPTPPPPPPPPPPAQPDPAVAAWLRNLRITAVRGSDGDARFIANGVSYRMGQVVNPQLNVRWTAIADDGRTLFFTDANGIIYQKRL